MSSWLSRSLALGALALSTVLACGAKSGLPEDGCADGETFACGSDEGACRAGKSRCVNGHLGPCEG
ncbi:MAG: hypothetical protein ABI193_15535, partial [Minicystis sp.]